MISINSRKLSLLEINQNVDIIDEIINSIRVASPHYLFLTWIFMNIIQRRYSGILAAMLKNGGLHLSLGRVQQALNYVNTFSWKLIKNNMVHITTFAEDTPGHGNHKQKVNIPFHTSHSWIMCSWGKHSRRCLWRVMYWPRLHKDVNIFNLQRGGGSQLIVLHS